MIQIVLLDPHPVVQKGFKTFFNKKDHIKVLGTFSKTQQLFDFLQKNTIDIVIIEMELKDVSAVQTVRKLKLLYPNISTLIFTSLRESVYGISILKAGAKGFLSKEISRETMIDAIEKVHHKGYHITSNFANQINKNVDLHRPRNAYGTLSSREIEVLKYLIEGKRNVKIAATLKIHQKTVNTYKSRLMKKLEVTNSADLYQQAFNLELI
ncbi:response regulator transcription factor [Flavobacteriaceae bacterium]|nr:response regulator transcription factor [Flavobacteriaceae bacterium]